jgi:hypothetical protein
MELYLHSPIHQEDELLSTYGAQGKILIQSRAGKWIAKIRFLDTSDGGGTASPDILLSTSCYLLTMEQCGLGTVLLP